MKRVLDVTCGARMMWFNKHHPEAIYMDKRNETHTLCDGRTLEIKPDMVADFRAIPLADNSVNLIVFDPSHFDKLGKTSWMAKKYGRLEGDWRSDIKQGLAECFRVLAPNGVLIFKWNQAQIKISEVLALTDHKPLFGHTTKKGGHTLWMTFMKPVVNNGEVKA